MKYIMTVILTFIGCSDVDATDRAGSFSDARFNDSIVDEPVVIDIDDLTFDEAFGISYEGRGEGETFWWRGNEYLLVLAESNDPFVLYHSKQDNYKLGWVLNNDDPDDDCYYNKRDECGVCNGPGKITWFRDKDGDGLGDHKVSIKSCYQPDSEEFTYNK